MNGLIDKAIKRLGTDCYINGKSGYAVIFPERYTQRIIGGVEISSHGRADPKKYFIYCNIGLGHGVRYGDIVSDNENAYYILWSDEVKSKFGDYVKICARMVKRGDKYI